MISSLAWIPKGAAKALPEYAEISEQDAEALKIAAEAEDTGASDVRCDFLNILFMFLARIETLSAHLKPNNLLHVNWKCMQDEKDFGSGTESDSDAEMDEADAVAKAKAFASVVKRSSAADDKDTLASAMAELDMDNYDDEDDEEGVAVQRILGGGNPGMAYYRDPRKDPYLTGVGDDSDADEDDSEADDLRLRDTDLLIMAVRNEEDISNLEVWVYEEPDERGEGNLYVHHSLLLPAFPLALAWGDCDPTGHRDRGNFAAVGSFEPGIEIWDLDVLDAVEPVATLGGADYEAARVEAAAEGSGKKKKKDKKGKTKAPEVPVKAGSHADAVLGLAWNSEFRNVLASASADKTVKVWDVATLQASHTLTHHSSKVQAVAWNPAEAPVLLSGGFDKRVCLADVRTPDATGIPAWDLSADIEALAWDPHAPTCFAASTENGEVVFMDARAGAGAAPLAQVAAHGKAVTALSFSPGVKGLMLTGSTDKRVKVWGLADGYKPTLLGQEDLKVGAVFSATFCKDAPLLIAAGGAKGEVAVWDTATCQAVKEFAEKQQEQ